jgi:hypothetical protein
MRSVEMVDDGGNLFVRSSQQRIANSGNSGCIQGKLWLRLVPYGRVPFLIKKGREKWKQIFFSLVGTICPSIRRNSTK